MFRNIFGSDRTKAADTAEAALTAAETATGDTATVRRIVAKLEALPPERARLVASAAYTLARAANADLDISDAETAIIEQALQQRGSLDEPTAVLVAEMAKFQANTVGGTEDYVVTREFAALATDQQKGRVQWLSDSIAAPIARKSRQMTLFIPKSVQGFVSIQDGSISLTNILIPVAETPVAQPAIQAAARMANRLRLPGGVFTILHVGEDSSMPDVRRPDVAGWSWNTLVRSGDVVDVISETSSAVNAGLIVLTTEGRHGFLDALRGSHSERVLHKAPCPLLAIPAGGFIASVLEAESEGQPAS